MSANGYHPNSPAARIVAAVRQFDAAACFPVCLSCGWRVDARSQQAKEQWAQLHRNLTGHDRFHYC